MFPPAPPPDISSVCTTSMRTARRRAKWAERPKATEPGQDSVNNRLPTRSASSTSLAGTPDQGQWPRRMLICMHSTSVRIDSATHDDLKRLAAELNTTVGNTVTLAVRALRQDRIGADLRVPLDPAEEAWLDAEFG